MYMNGIFSLSVKQAVIKIGYEFTIFIQFTFAVHVIDCILVSVQAADAVSTVKKIFGVMHNLWKLFHDLPK